MLNRLLRPPRCITNLGSSTTLCFHSLTYPANLSHASPTRQLRLLSIAGAKYSDEIKSWDLALEDSIEGEKARIWDSRWQDLHEVQDANGPISGRLETVQDKENKVKDRDYQSHDPEDGNTHRKDEVADRQDKVRDQEDAQSPSRTSNCSSGIAKSQSSPPINGYDSENGERCDQKAESPQLSELVSLNVDTRHSPHGQKYPTTPVSLGASYDGTDSAEDQSKETAEMFEPMDDKWAEDFKKINSVYRGRWYRSDEDSTTISPTKKFRLQPINLNHQARNNRRKRKSIIQLWRKTNQARKWWQSTLLWALRNDQRLAIILLHLNLKQERPWLPEYVVNDCLDQLACVETFSTDRDAPQSTHFQSIFRTACMFLTKYGESSGSASLSQRTILILTKECIRWQLKNLITLIVKYRSGLTTSTKLHIMRRFVSFGEVDRALSILQTVPTLELSMDKVQSCCVALLRADLATEDLYSLRTQILTYILQIGIRPNRQTSNVIMLNAAEAGDLSTAWQAHEIAEDNGLVPDEYSYAILLKGAQHGDSKDRIQLIYQNAKRAGLFSKSSRLGFELLYAVFLTENGTFDSSPYTALLPLYQEFFDTSSLQTLGLAVDQETLSRRHSEVSEPSTHALSLMVRAWLLQYYMTGPIQEVYERYMNAVRSGHPEISKLAEDTYTSNAFIVAFGKSRQHLALCTTVVQNMLKPPRRTTKVRLVTAGRARACVDKPEDSANATKFAMPDVQTWNILLFAFVCNGKPNAAERVLTIMKRRGYKSDEVTWNSLLNHYTRAQDIPGVVNTVERMEKAGFDTDDYTIKALGQVVDLPRLMEAFEKATARVATRSSEKQLSEGGETRFDPQEKAQALEYDAQEHRSCTLVAHRAYRFPNQEIWIS